MRLRNFIYHVGMYLTKEQTFGNNFYLLFTLFYGIKHPPLVWGRHRVTEGEQNSWNKGNLSLSLLSASALRD